MDTITELGAKLKARQVTAVDLVRQFGGDQHAIKAAKAVDADRKRERFRGPLQGIPYRVAERVSADSTIVKRLSNAGALLVGGAAGPIPFSIAAETWRSGFTGLRPTYGLVSRHGAAAVAWTMDTFGPLCQSAADCGLVLEAIAGGDPLDPGSAGKGFYFVPQYARALSDLTVGSVDAPALARLRDIGLKTQAITLPDFPYVAMVETIAGAEKASSEGQTSEIRATDYLRAQRIRTLVKQEFRKLFATVDVVAAPASADPAGVLAGLPALYVPCGGNVDLQLTGPAFSENTLLAIGKAFQQRTGYPGGNV